MSGQHTYFHVAPPAAREAIAADELLWAGQSKDVCDLDEQGVYLFASLDDCHRFGATTSSFVDADGNDLGVKPWFPDGYDIWQLELEPGDAARLVADPLE